MREVVRVVHPNRRLFFLVPMVMIGVAPLMLVSKGFAQGVWLAVAVGIAWGVIQSCCLYWAISSSWVEIRGADTLVVKSPFRRSVSVEIDGSLELIVPQRFFGRTECPYVVEDGKVVYLTPLSPRYDLSFDGNRVCSEFLDELDALIHSE